MNATIAIDEEMRRRLRAAAEADVAVAPPFTREQKDKLAVLWRVPRRAS